MYPPFFAPRPLLGTRRAGGRRERPRINLHKLGNAFLGDPATHFIRRRQFAALFPGFESAARAHDQLARWKSLFWPFSLTVTVRGPLKFKKKLGVDRVVVPCQLSLGRVWIHCGICGSGTRSPAWPLDGASSRATARRKSYTGYIFWEMALGV